MDDGSLEKRILDLEEQLRDLTARRDIYQAICDYMHGQDRLLPQVQRGAFHDDAFVDCGPFAGEPDGYVNYAQTALAACAGSQHLIGQANIRIEGDIAFGEVYHIAWHRIEENGEPKDLFVGARYIDRYEKRAGRWKIAKRRETMDWSRTDPPSDSFLRLPFMHLSVRGPVDFSFSDATPRKP
jgi:hypothetical protein